MRSRWWIALGFVSLFLGCTEGPEVAPEEVETAPAVSEDEQSEEMEDNPGDASSSQDPEFIDGENTAQVADEDSEAEEFPDASMPEEEPEDVEEEGPAPSDTEESPPIDRADTGSGPDGADERADTDTPETDGTPETDTSEGPCISDPTCGGPGTFGCSEDGTTIVLCTEVEFACFQWVELEACAQEEVCSDGACVPACTPQCPPGFCGEDGCGSTCPPCLGGDQVCESGWCEQDGDGDGYGASVDCEDGNPQIHPGAVEVYYDGKDNDCSTSTPDGDQDGDGAVCTCMGGSDCNDLDEEISPLLLDLVGDGKDINCDGIDGVDADGDSFASMASGGGDCNDANPLVNPGKGDEFGDGLDSNCDGVDGFAPPPLPDGRLCTLWGSAGESLVCPLGIARLGEGGPLPASARGAVVFHSSKVELKAISTLPCEEATCADSAVLGSAPLETGHTFRVAPTGGPTDPFGGKITWMVSHSGAVSTSLSTAVLDPNQTLSGNPHFAWFHFQLKVDIDEGNPVKAVMTEVEGMSADWQIKQTTTDDGLVVLYP